MTKQSEATQIAVMSVMLQSVKDAQTAMAADIREIKNNKYVTQNDLELRMGTLQKDVLEKISFLTDKVGFQTKVGIAVGGVMLIVTTLLGILVKIALGV